MFGSVGDVQVINCKHLYVKRDTFFDVNDLQRLSFVNIEELVLDENAFSIRSDRHLRSLEFINVSLTKDSCSLKVYNGNFGIGSCRRGADTLFEWQHSGNGLG
jgi:hypothetical protein